MFRHQGTIIKQFLNDKGSYVSNSYLFQAQFRPHFHHKSYKS
jgi:hypothetical protein